MSVRPCSLLLLGACATGEKTAPVLLDRYVTALGETTADAASPAITAALVLSGVGVALCARRAEAEAAPWTLGAAPPLHEELIRALGEPVVVEVNDEPGAFTALLGGVTLGGPEGALRLSTRPGASSFEVTALALSAVSGGSTTGTADLGIAEGCLPGDNLVSGSTRWTDGEGREAVVLLPADAAAEGISLGSVHPMLPQSGALGWSSVIDGGDRSLTTEDAATLSVEEGSALPTARWPTQVVGEGWEARVELLLAP